MCAGDLEASLDAFSVLFRYGLPTLTERTAHQNIKVRRETYEKITLSLVVAATLTAYRGTSDQAAFGDASTTEKAAGIALLGAMAYAIGGVY